LASYSETSARRSPAKTLFTGASLLDYLRAGVTALCLELIFVSAEYAMPQDVPLSDGLG
jgi:hypothetical protein